MRFPRRNRLTVLGLVCLLVVLVGAVSFDAPMRASAATATVPAIADTYATLGEGAEDHGTRTRWSVDGRPAALRNAFVKFEVPAAPEGSHYVSATMRAFNGYDGYDGSPGSGVDVYVTSSDWSETQVRWRDQPERGTWLDRRNRYASQSWVEWDVTAGVPARGGRLSFMLATTARSWLGFESRENVSGRAPQLELVAEPTTDPGPGAPPEPRPATAAAAHGWGSPVAGDEFDYTGAPDADLWNVYDAAGHAGRGRRSPEAWHVDGDVARVSGDAAGTTGGMSANFDRRRYGRWEARMRVSDRDSEYHPVLLLWPDSRNWPCEGEVNYAEGTRNTDKMHMFLHYSCDNKQTKATRRLDPQRWHHYAVEWTPEAVVGYLDGEEWFRDEDPSHQPRDPMHQTIQLDWFPDGTRTRPSWMEVDWVRVYDIDSTPTPPRPSGDVRLAVLGDVNHEGNSSRASREGKIAASIAAWRPDAVALAGDFQYQYGDCAALVGDFDRTGFGDLMPKVIGTAGGTHDYTSTPSSAADYRRHMEGTCPGQTTGPSLSAQAWDRTIQPYEPHAVDLGAWTVVSMPSRQWNSSHAAAYGPRWAPAALTEWLTETLTRVTAEGDHVAVLMHEPYWSSGTDGHSETEGDAQRPWIEVLDEFNVRLVISGSQHNYERFHPQNADSTRNDATGTQQFQVSTGGIALRDFISTAPHSAVKDDTTFGWARMTLRADGAYDWEFVPTEGSFTDSGSRRSP